MLYEWCNSQTQYSVSTYANVFIEAIGAEQRCKFTMWKWNIVLTTLKVTTQDSCSLQMKFPFLHRTEAVKYWHNIYRLASVKRRLQRKCFRYCLLKQGKLFLTASTFVVASAKFSFTFILKKVLFTKIYILCFTTN